MICTHTYQYPWQCIVCDNVSDYYLRKCPQCQLPKEQFCRTMNINYDSNYEEDFKKIGIIELECNHDKNEIEIVKLKISIILTQQIMESIHFQQEFKIKPIDILNIQNYQLNSIKQEQVDQGVKFQSTFQILNDVDLIIFENRIKAQIYLNQCIQLKLECPIKKYIELKNVFPDQKQQLTLNDMLKYLRISNQKQQFPLAAVVIELLKNSYTFQFQMLQSLQFPIPEEESRLQGFQNLIILAFKATCAQDNRFKFNQEIIEFQAQVFDIDQRKITQDIQLFIKPVENRFISEYCSKLTGIQQYQINNGIYLQQAINQCAEKFKDLGRVCIITLGDSDLTLLKKEGERKKIKLAQIFTYYINIKRVFPQSLRFKNYLRELSLKDMLDCCGLSYQLNYEKGIDVNVQNVTRIVEYLIIKENFRFDEKMIQYTYKF